MRAVTSGVSSALGTLYNFIRGIRGGIHFPQLSAVYESLAKFLAQGYTVAAIYIDIVDFSKIEVVYGSGTAEKVLHRLADGFTSLTRKLDGEDGSCTIGALGGDDFVLFFAFRGVDVPQDEFLAAKVREIREFLENHINEYNLSYSLDHPIGIHVGCALVQTDDVSRIEMAVYSAIKRAKTLAKDSDAIREEKRKALTELLSSGGIRTVFQPMVSLKTGEVFGYEALSRGPEGTPFESPLALFSLAEELDMLYQLERACRETAITSSSGLAHGTKLFLNVHPEIIYDPQFSGVTMAQLVESVQLSPDDIIIEVTERGSITNYETFLAVLKHYRDQGYSIAIDDAGAGYSSLQSIAELRPDYIKVDMSLVRNLHLNRARHSVIEALSILAKRINAKVVAEGIECEDELKAIIDLDVELGQGYYLGRPGPGFTPVSQKAKSIILAYPRNAPSCNVRRKTSVLEVTMCTPSAKPDTLTRDVVEMFKKESGLQGVAVVRNEKPVGLIMKDKLYYRLGSQFGYSIYMGRPVTVVMDKNPLIVRAETPINEVADVAMARDENRLYDHVIVVDNDGNYQGVVSIRRLLVTITKLQVDAAMCANPLTRLPGNPVIEEEIQARLAEREGFAVLYIDLDNFKPFNDVYGFERGDEVIKLTARAISDSVRLHGGPNHFIGHVGGDDFVAITAHDQYEETAQAIIKSFDSQIPWLYDPGHREQGYIETFDRKGNMMKFPIMSISIAIIVNEPGETASYHQFVRNVAELKSYAKSLEGSNYVKERRRAEIGKHMMAATQCSG